MTSFKGEFDGYTYEADWERASADRVVWTAVIRRGEEWVASPTGRLHNASANDDFVTDHVRLAVETGISSRIGLDH